MHIAVDVKTKKLLAIEITDEGWKNVETLSKESKKEHWAAETFLSGVKRIFGETTKTKTKEPFTNCSTKQQKINFYKKSQLYILLNQL
ncbi:MAG: hypothetical protein QW762_03390 [Candidatus Thermoplasmatota archaeon]